MIADLDLARQHHLAAGADAGDLQPAGGELAEACSVNRSPGRRLRRSV
jgi:hypothetical protein